jgi:hypothetical protein
MMRRIQPLPIYSSNIHSVNIVKHGIHSESETKHPARMAVPAEGRKFFRYVAG